MHHSNYVQVPYDCFKFIVNLHYTCHTENILKYLKWFHNFILLIMTQQTHNTFCNYPTIYVFYCWVKWKHGIRLVTYNLFPWLCIWEKFVNNLNYSYTDQQLLVLSLSSWEPSVFLGILYVTKQLLVVIFETFWIASCSLFTVKTSNQCLFIGWHSNPLEV